jgi:hypothetical protein
MGKSIDFLARAARMEIDKMKLDVNDVRRWRSSRAFARSGAVEDEGTKKRSAASLVT